jgi:hypothetical protein
MKLKIHISEKLLLFVTGVLPVSSVGLHSMGLISIQLMVLPNLLLLAISAYLLREYIEFKAQAWNCWCFGILSVFLYDVVRIPFALAGWNDFIPGLGGWITGEDSNAIVGYLWRYLGNGAGLGLGFGVLHSIFKFKNLVLAGLIYGLCICLCLDLILTFSESAQELMFKVTPLSLIGGVCGHAVYGLSLGVLMRWASKKSQIKRSRPS